MPTFHELLGELSPAELQAITEFRNRPTERLYHCPPPIPKSLDEWFEFRYYGGN